MKLDRNINPDGRGKYAEKQRRHRERLRKAIANLSPESLKQALFVAALMHDQRADRWSQWPDAAKFCGLPFQAKKKL